MVLRQCRVHGIKAVWSTWYYGSVEYMVLRQCGVHGIKAVWSTWYFSMLSFDASDDENTHLDY